MSQHDAYKKKIESRAAGIIKSLGISLTKPAKWVKWKDTGKECYLITFPWGSKLDDLRKAEKAMKTAFRAAAALDDVIFPHHYVGEEKKAIAGPGSDV